MALVKSKSYFETPAEWADHLRTARQKPSPFQVIEVKHQMIKNSSQFYKPLFRATCPIKVRPIKEILFQSGQEVVKFREDYSAHFMETSFLPRKAVHTFQNRSCAKLYSSRLPISRAKYEDLNSLADYFKRPLSAEFFRDLPVDDTIYEPLLRDETAETVDLFDEFA